MTSGAVEVYRDVSVRNRNGLHARPAAEFVKLAAVFEAEVWVEKDGLEVNGKSIMGVLMLAAEAGSILRLRTVGVDAEAALEALARLIEHAYTDEELEELEAPDAEGEP